MLTLTRGLLESETELREFSAKFVFCCPGYQHSGLLVTWTALGFHCGAGFSLVVVSEGYSVVVLLRLLAAVSSLVVELGF